MGFRRWLTDRIVEFLTEPLPYYERRVWNDLGALRRHIRKGDVVLVEGDNRISAIIRYLTQSSWSHSALYIGDELLLRGGPAAERAEKALGDDARELLVEALGEGVVATPLRKYVDYNIRLMRPHRLRPEHRKQILDSAVRTIGWRYDLRNIMDLARYLIPVKIVPGRFRRTALHFGSGVPTEVICSSLIGQLFQSVGFPILPTVEFTDSPGARSEEHGHLLRRVFGYESADYTGLLRMRHPTLLTPRDFDLSPYFEIVKFNVVASGGFDYQRIHWASEDADGASKHPAPEESRADSPRSLWRWR